MVQILSSPFIHDIKTFCQIMEANLPKKYMTCPTDNSIRNYHLDLDNNSLRVINIDGLYSLI